MPVYALFPKPFRLCFAESFRQPFHGPVHDNKILVFFQVIKDLRFGPFQVNGPQHMRRLLKYTIRGLFNVKLEVLFLSLVSRGKITQTIVQVKIAPENVTLNFIKHISRDDQIVSFRLHSYRSCSRDVTELIL